MNNGYFKKKKSRNIIGNSKGSGDNAKICNIINKSFED